MDQGVEEAGPAGVPHVAMRGDRVLPAFPADAADEAAWAGHGEAWRALADELVAGASLSMWPVVVTRADGGAPAEGVVALVDHPGLAQAILAATGRRPRFLDHAVLLDGEGPRPPPPDRGSVAADLAAAVADLYPLDGDGPLAGDLPALVRLAAEALLRDDAGPYAGSAGREAAPAALAGAVAAAAAGARPGLALPAGAEDVARAAHRAVADALASLGGSVGGDAGR